MDRHASVLVSGSAKQMPRDVREAFRDALAGHEKVRVSLNACHGREAQLFCRAHQLRSSYPNV